MTLKPIISKNTGFFILNIFPPNLLSTYIIACEYLCVDMAIVLKTYNTTLGDWFYVKDNFTIWPRAMTMTL